MNDTRYVIIGLVSIQELYSRVEYGPEKGMGIDTRTPRTEKNSELNKKENRIGKYSKQSCWYSKVISESSQIDGNYQVRKIMSPKESARGNKEKTPYYANGTRRYHIHA